jgi:predicted nuclease of predicted toxin-antitoxin system
LRIKLDENLPVEAAVVLRPLGHDVDTVDDEAMVGAADEDVLRAATAEGRLLITLDRGFADIRRHPPGTHAGVVVLRPSDQLAPTVIAALRDLVVAHPLEDMVGCNTIVRSGLVRIRRP